MDNTENRDGTTTKTQEVPRPILDREDLTRLHARTDFWPIVYLTLLLVQLLAFQLAYFLFPSFFTFLSCFVAMGALQHHLSIVQHEANHFLLFKNRTLNECVGALAAFSIGFTMAYRKHHFEHHRRIGYQGDPDDPNYKDYPNSLGYFVVDILKHVSGFAAVFQFLKQSMVGPRGTPKAKLDLGLAGVALTQLAILDLFWMTGHWQNYFLLWLLPLITLAKTLTHFRNLAEHIQLRNAGDPELNRYRTVYSNLLEAYFFAPMNFNYHAEHHFYPGIPYYKLPAAHHLLKQKEEYARASEVTAGYLRLLFRHAVTEAPAKLQ